MPMTYTLEINHINPSENVFFNEAGIVNPEDHIKHHGPIILRHINNGSWTNPKAWSLRQVQKFQRPTGEWQRTQRIEHFVSVEAAVSFFKDIIADGSEYRRLLRDWQQKNGILNETNVLDEAGNIVNVVHACQAHKCIRFGSCPEQGSGCAVVPIRSKDSIYPIYHIDTI
jgi:hypothetical protein